MNMMFRRARAAGFIFITVVLGALMCAGSALAAANVAGLGASGKDAPPAVSGSTRSAAIIGAQEKRAPRQAALAATAKPAEVTELWTGSLYSSNFRATLCFSAQGAVRGVLLLRLANGKTDVYHIVGKVKNNEIEASHSSGHTFKGHLLSSNKVEGVISLKNGMKIKVDGKRLQDVPVTEDCSPLPQ